MKKDRKIIEGETLARQASGNRERMQTAIPSPTENRGNREIFELRESNPLFRVFGVVRGYIHFLIFQDQLMQVVDFHDRFGYFRIIADISHAFQQKGKIHLAILLRGSGIRVKKPQDGYNQRVIRQ